MRGSKVCWRVVLGLVTLCTGLFARAQEPVATGSFRAQSRVDIVNVEVLVTDRAGKPVTGLTAADFEVLQDGVPQAITNFRSGAQPAALTEVPDTEDAVHPVVGQTPAADGALSILVFVDNASLSNTNRDEMLGHLRGLFESGWPGAGVPVMLASGGRTVRVVQHFTTDSERLLAGLAALRREAFAGGDGGVTGFLTQVTEGTSLAGSGSEDFGLEDARSSLMTMRSAAQQAYEVGRSYMGAVATLFDSIAGVPGQKVMLLLSSGLQVRPGEAILQRWEARFGGSQVEPGFSASSEASRYSLSSEFRTLLQRANASRVTIVALEGSGRGAAGGAADQRLMERDVTVGTTESLNLQQTLASMAQATGGRVLTRNNALGEVVRSSVEDLRGGYSLGFRNPKPDEAGYRSLKVRVKRDGTVLHHREGYLNKTADERMAERSLGALLVGDSTNPLDVSITLRGAKPERGDVFNAEVLAIVPLGGVLLQPRGDVHEGQLSVWVAVQGEDGRITQAPRQLFPIRLPNSRLLSAQGQSMGCMFQLRLRQGEYRIAAAVRDDYGQIESTALGQVRVSAEVPTPEAAR